jgi:DNA-binding NarL/FixJ family response regulator
MSQLSIFIAEDHELFRDGLRLLAQDLADVVNVYEARTLDELLALLSQQGEPDLLLADIQMPGSKGLDGIRQLKRDYPFLPMIVISSLEMGANIRNVMKLGVSGFIAKSTARADMLAAIQKVLNGEFVCIGEAPDSSTQALSPRQLDTLTLMAQGLSNKEIADTLAISDATAREHVSEIIRKLNTANRMQAVLAAKDLGILID